MERKIRVGLIGAGWFATRRHLPDLYAQPEVDLLAICRRDPEKLGQIADHFDIPGRYQDYKDMFTSEDLDAVVITTPHSLHFAQAEAALSRGLHVLLEKPMALKVREADALVNMADLKDRVLSVALNPPYWRHTRYARELINEGKIGQIEGISMQWFGNAEAVFGLAPLPDDMPGLVKPSLYRGNHELSGGGHLMDTGSHLISELIWLCGLPAQSVMAQMDNPKLDMRSTVQVSLEGGVFANIICVGNSSYESRRIRNTYYGNKGTLTIKGMPYSVALEVPGGDSLRLSEDEMDDPPGPVTDFIRAIRDRHVAVSTGRHGADVVRVMEAAYRSSECGECVSIETL